MSAETLLCVPLFHVSGTGRPLFTPAVEACNHFALQNYTKYLIPANMQVIFSYFSEDFFADFLAHINYFNNVPQSGIEIYVTPDNSVQLQVKLEQDTVWLTASQMAQLFGRDVRTIRKHINNALREELSGEVVGAKFASTTQHGAMIGKTQTNEVMFYNLEMVTSVARNLNGTE